MSHEYLYELPSKYLDINNHPQPDFKNQLRWWKRTSLGWIAPTINLDEWIMLDAFQQMLICGDLGVNFDEANKIMDTWDKWEMDAERLVRKIDEAKLLPAGAKSWNNENNYINTRINFYGQSGNTLLIQEMTTKRFEACKWKKRKLRYYLLNAETKICIAVPSPKRYIRNHPDMESVVCHMAKIVQKRLEKTIKLISE